MSQDNREPAASLQVEPPAGLTGNGEQHGERVMFDLVTTLWRRFKEKLHTSNSSETIGRSTLGEPQISQIEDYRPGYPQFSALVGSHASFHVCRRFLRVRARLLLLKQDELSLLESQLDRIDRDETRELFLGNRRRDTNGERRETLEKLDTALADYDALLDRNRRILACNDPSRECVMNLQHWVDNTCSLAQCETAYLAYTKDLMTILSTQDDAVARLAPLMETILRSLYKIVGKRRCDISRDPNISIFSVALLRNLTRTLIAWFVVVFLLVPIVIINALSSLALRMAIIVVASAVLVTTLSSFTNAKTVELFVSGATYATVLVVFISGNPTQGSRAGNKIE